MNFITQRLVYEQNTNWS